MPSIKSSPPSIPHILELEEKYKKRAKEALSAESHTRYKEILTDLNELKRKVMKDV